MKAVNAITSPNIFNVTGTGYLRNNVFMLLNVSIIFTGKC